MKSSLTLPHFYIKTKTQVQKDEARSHGAGCDQYNPDPHCDTPTYHDAPVARCKSFKEHLAGHTIEETICVKTFTTFTIVNFSGEPKFMLCAFHMAPTSSFTLSEVQPEVTSCLSFTNTCTKCPVDAMGCATISLFWSTHASLTTGEHKTTGWPDFRGYLER